MKRPRSMPIVVAFVATLAVAGCGASSSPSATPAATVPGSAPAATAAVSAVRSGVTQARLGDATAATAKAPEHLLSHGKVVHPGDVTPDKADREGVGAAVDCAHMNDLVTDGSVADTNAAILCLLNGVRAGNGLVALTSNAKLATAAAAYAKAMVAGKFFSHTGADGSSMSDRIGDTGYLTGGWSIGENIAWGGGDLSTPRAIVIAWMNSEGHRANILTPEFRDIGLGVATGTPTPDGEAGATYVNDFGVNGDSVDPGAADTSAVAASAATASKAVVCGSIKSAKARHTCVRKRRVAKARAAARARARARAAAQAAAGR